MQKSGYYNIYSQEPDENETRETRDGQDEVNLSVHAYQSLTLLKKETEQSYSSVSFPNLNPNGKHLNAYLVPYIW